MKLYRFVIKKVLLDKCNYHSRNRIPIQRSPFLAVMKSHYPYKAVITLSNSNFPWCSTFKISFPAKTVPS
jgi:hypothetical protein